MDFHQRSSNLGFPYSVITAVDGLDVLPPSTWTASREAYGCALSHRSALEQATGTTLILEDDALIPPDFQERLRLFLAAVPSDWQLLKLGGEHLLPSELITPGVMRCERTVRTHAYVARGPMIAQLIGVIDETCRHWDACYGRITSYAPDPFLVNTTGVASDIPDSRPLVTP